MIRLIKVSGNSLVPEYGEGDFVLIAKIPFFLNSYRVGDVVVFDQPSYGVLIKKIERIVGGGKEFFVIGTHEHSIDSRLFGAVKKDSIIGKVIWHIRKPARQSHP
jgi:signal peptidase I